MLPTRRAVLSGALSGVLPAGLLAGCTDESPINTPDADPDAALVTEVAAAQRALVALLDQVTAGRSRRQRALTPTREVHVIQLAVLGSEASSPTAPTPYAGPARTAYLALATAEDELGRTLREAVGKAQSGPFARVLASMAAAAAQQAVVVRGLA